MEGPKVSAEVALRVDVESVLVPEKDYTALGNE
jgi:hypothetical protein